MVPNQPFSPFIFCWVYVPANTTSILYFESSAHTHAATSGLCHLPHAPGEHVRKNVELSDLNGVRFIHFAYCKSIQGFTKPVGLIQKSSKNFWVFLALCESAHVQNHHAYNKRDFFAFFLPKGCHFQGLLEQQAGLYLAPGSGAGMDC